VNFLYRALTKKESHNETDTIKQNGRTFLHKDIKKQLEFESEELEKFIETEKSLIKTIEELKDLKTKLEEEYRQTNKKNTKNEKIRNDALLEIENSKKLIKEYSEK